MLLYPMLLHVYLVYTQFFTALYVSEVPATIYNDVLIFSVYYDHVIDCCICLDCIYITLHREKF